MSYLEDHRDGVLNALRHGGDLIGRSGRPWETTCWTRTAGDAETLRDMMRDAVIEAVLELRTPTNLMIALVESCDVGSGADSSRFGVSVSVRSIDALV